jgi:DNA polymerase-3 subunit epsilon
MAGFAVVDVQTTGMNARRGDRVVEIAVVHTDVYGNVTGQWHTVVDPDRGLDGTESHGIRELEALIAPRFADISDSLMQLLYDRVLVAHNAEFVERFLAAEYKRVGRELRTTPALCTMQLSKGQVKSVRRSLDTCCDALGVPRDNARSALADAHAVAQLLSVFIAKGLVPEQADKTLGVSEPSPKPDTSRWLPRGTRQWRLAVDGPLNGPDENPRDYEWLHGHVEYLTALENALVDRLLSQSELQELSDIANSHGMARDEVEMLHREFFRLVVKVAWRDGELSKTEKTDLAMVGELLGISESEQKRIVSEERRRDFATSTDGLDLFDIAGIFTDMGAVVRIAGRGVREAIFSFDI